MKPYRFIAFIFLAVLPLFANYQSIYSSDTLRKDISEGNVAKYQVDTFPSVTLGELKSKGVYNESSTLVKHISGTPDFNTIANADVCKVDNPSAYSSTIYELDLPNGIVTCMYSLKGDLYNPIGVYKVSVPEIKAYYALDTKAAMTEKAEVIALAEAQFEPLFAKKREIIAQMKQETNAGFLTIPELLTAAVLTDSEIIDIEATKSTGKFQLKPGYTSKFTQSGEVVDNSEYLLTDAATIFEVYTGLSAISMNFLMILVVGFGAYGFLTHGFSKLSSKVEGRKDNESNMSYFGGAMLGILLLFPVNEADIDLAAEEGAKYELLKTRYQGFEKFGYYTFADWGKEAAKVIIDAEIDALIRKSGLATKDQIASTWAQRVQSQKLDDFYTFNHNSCLNDIYIKGGLTTYEGAGKYSETDKGIFPSSEHWAYVSYLARFGTKPFYKSGEGGLLHDGAAGEGAYPKFAFSSCGKADYLSGHYRNKREELAIAYNNLTFAGGNNPKLLAISGLIEFQYQLYRDWGYLAVLGLPVTKMQTEYIGGIGANKRSIVLEKLNKNIDGGDNKIMHSVMSSLPYLFVPGAKNVFDITMSNGTLLGGASGAIAAASQTDDGILGGFLALFGGAAGAAIGSTSAGSAALGTAFAYMAAKITLSILPILGIVILGIVRFIVIILKIFAFHFLSLFMMPISFITGNLQAVARFTIKILSNMLEIVILVLAVWLAITANSLIHSIGDVFGKNIIAAMLDNSTALGVLNAKSVEVAGYNLSSIFDQMLIYFFDGFMEVAISVFSILIIYKIIISLHQELFNTIELGSNSVLDNSIESMKSEAQGWGARI